MTPLEGEIRRIVAIDGPIPVDRYMALCLGHPQHGYYTTRDPLGAAGDFVTAPEVSQMFGELIGAWAATVWRQMGSPPNVRLVEMGPGRGTLMADALRAARALPEFYAALSVHLVETSPVLRALQEGTLANAGVPIAWHHALEEVPAGATIAVANEFVDALPISQFVKDRDGWHVRTIGVVDGKLAFLAAPDPMLNKSAADTTPVGTILERRYDRPVALLAGRIAQHGGAALIIDYGHTESGFGDTLQAVRGHAFTDPLEGPGEADLTAQVDFAAVVIWAQHQGAVTRGPIPQGEFLRRLGIEQRAARLKGSATPQQAADIDAAVTRLTAPDQMGELFKVLAIAAPKLGPLPGFDR
ncbi:MAG: class I SAM-dependent methyltransferase [Alphaproteobacteria bacterium]|nr:MAG: class I SAM-dependent methyltransferase [Alphaproteobacteria bacterium]